MSDVETKDEQLPSQDVVLNKYKMAAQVTNGILEEVIKKCVAGAKITEICKFGDDRLLEETALLFKTTKDMKKGIAFPTSLNVNNIICHYSPIPEENAVIEELHDADLVKIDLGVHIDGFAAVVGHTIVVGASPENKTTGRKADVILAAHYAAEAALRMMRPKTENMQITEVIGKATADFKCKPIEGMQSHEMKQFVYDTDKTIILNPTEEQKKNVEKCELDLYECWILDILVSTGNGKAREHPARTTLYKKNDNVYQLRMTTSCKTYSEIANKCLAYPFNIRHLEDIKRARLGLTECVTHDVVQQMQVFAEKDDELVAQFKSTVLIMPNRPVRLTGLPFDSSLYKSECKISDADVKSILNQPLKQKQAGK